MVKVKTTPFMIKVHFYKRINELQKMGALNLPSKTLSAILTAYDEAVRDTYNQMENKNE